jgi:hypothetical protein
MGNFKHQSLRNSDREDKEKERDIRDREGQEKLRVVRMSICCTFCHLFTYIE